MSQPRRIGWVSLVGLALVAPATLIVPILLIRPFSPQTPTSVAVAFLLRRWAPLATILMGAVALPLIWQLWRRARPMARAGAIVALLPILGSIWLARQNLFERMFAPLPDPRFVRPAEASLVQPEDMVLAVSIRGDAVAFPVRQVSYHHLVQDSVGQVPIVATY